MMWVPEAESSDPYKLLVCVPTGSRLFVMIEGPAPNKSPDAGPETSDMTLETSTGEELTFWSSTRTSAERKTKTIYLVQFDGPTEATPLRVRMRVDGNEVLSAVAIPVRTEPI